MILHKLTSSRSEYELLVETERLRATHRRIEATIRQLDRAIAHAQAAIEAIHKADAQIRGGDK